MDASRSHDAAPTCVRREPVKLTLATRQSAVMRPLEGAATFLPGDEQKA